MGAYGVGCELDDVCSACNIYYTDGYPGFCCDMAWDEGGLTCLYVETEWGLDCGGCNCFGDFAFCEDQGLVMCSDYSCAESLSQCPPECDLGDVNCDGVLNILDIVIASYTILDNEYTAIGDVNGDGELNILDLVIMVNWVLYGMSDNTDIDWVSIPAGIYTYGQFDAILSIDYDYQISKYEITNAQYVTYLEDALASGDINVLIGSVLGYYPGDEENAAGDYIYLEIIDEHSQIIYDGISFSIVDGYEDHPVVEVSWFGANAFAEHYGWRLPDEYEWEKAARGDTGYDYPFGNSMNGSQANYYDSGDPYEQGEWSDWPNTSPVGFYNGQNNDGFVTTDSPSPYGVYDMAGNVWEYTGSWYFDGSPLRVRRGGSWYVGLTSGWCRSWLRDGNTPAGTYYDIGFRVARTN
jgi:formylglycine-generating enzyme required for sulfatase activity